MSQIFEELDYRDTELGELTLRRRSEPRLDNVLVHEVKLGDEFLMSSLFTVGEEALAELTLQRLDGDALDVVVGGLGLGYTAAAALRDERLRSLVVVEFLGPVVEWHRNGLVPLGDTLTRDPRCRLINGDFFALAGSSDGFDFEAPERRFHAILLDVDHSPSHHLGGASAAFYSTPALAEMQRHLHPGGIFSMWSNDPPDQAFVKRLCEAFEEVEAELVEFENPYSGGVASCTIYLCRSGQRPRI